MEKYLNEDEIWNILTGLSSSQGLYGRICRRLEESGRKEEILKEWASQKFKDAVDLVMWIEG